MRKREGKEVKGEGEKYGEMEAKREEVRVRKMEKWRQREKR